MTKKQAVRRAQYLEAIKPLQSASVASFVLGLISFFLAWTGLLGFILSVIAISKAKRSKGVPTNPHKAFRIIGLILGILSLLSSLFFMIGVPIIILSTITLAGLGAIGAGIWALITYGPMLLDMAYDWINNLMMSTFGMDISGIQQLIESIKQFIEQIQNMMSSVSGGETALLLL